MGNTCLNDWRLLRDRYGEVTYVLSSYERNSMPGIACEQVNNMWQHWLNDSETLHNCFR